MKIYQLRVSIVGIGRVYRIIEVSDECTFEKLQQTIYNSFQMDEDHLYSFFITKADTKSIRTILDAPEITHPLNAQDGMGFAPRKKSADETKIEYADLNEKDVFHYNFDFGLDILHRIRVVSVRESERNKCYIKVIKSVGKLQRAPYDAYE